MEVEMVPPGLTSAQQKFGLVDAIDATIIRYSEATKRSEGRQEVDGRKDCIGDFACGYFTRPANNAGQAIATFVAGSFAVAQRARLAPKDGTLRVSLLVLRVLVLIPRAVVTSINHQSVVSQLQLIQCIQQPTGFVVEFLNDISV